MLRLLTNAQMRAADEFTIHELGVSSEELMRRAGEAIAEETERAAKIKNARSVLVVCGNGNNGGDGYVCARILHERGINVRVYAFDGNLSPDCFREKQRYFGEYGGEISADIVVDCIFGTGLARPVGGVYKEVIDKINGSGAYVIAADIPSGLNGDNGLIMGTAVKAHLTVAIAEYKIGMLLNDGIDICGKVIKKDIGIAADGDYISAYTDEDMKKFYPARRRNTHKGSYGTANIVAGSEQYRGAAALSVEAALRSGCGYVKLTSCTEVINCLAARFPQVIYQSVSDLSAEAVAVGMGCGRSEELYEAIKYLLENYEGKLIIDADGLNVLSDYGKEILLGKRCKILITPHVKEFSRLTGRSVAEILQNPVSAAQNFAREYGITVLLKGAASVLADGDRTAINYRGNSALAKGGSGDMLSGLICGNAARGLPLFEAAVASNYVLGVAAEKASEEKTEYCAIAEDIMKFFPATLKNLTAD